MNSPRQPKHHEKRAVEPLRRVCIERSQHLSDTVSPQRVDFVRHDLRPKPQAIARGGLHHRSQAMRRGNLRRHRANKNGSCRVAQLVSLDDDTRTRLARVALGDDKHHIAAFQDQSSGSRTVSSQSSIAAFSGCLDNIALSRRISARMRGSRRSGTQCCTGRSPCARKRSRREAMRCCAVRGGSLFRGRSHARNVTCYGKKPS
jgi:hypothetical protein